MCENAHQIQLKWKPQDGDFAYTKGDEVDGGEYSERVSIIWNELMPLGYHNWDDRWYLPSSAWLPRIDQLCDMIKNTHTIGATIQGLYWFYEPEHFCPNSDDDFMTCKCADIGIERRKRFNTIEKFALAFVMDEVYKKRWNGFEWIKDAPTIASASHTSPY